VRHIIGAAQLLQTSPVQRCSTVVDDAAVASALHSDRRAATGLELFENEGLLELENVVLTIEHHSHAWRNGIAGDHQCAPHWQARVRRRY
jgi:hypothetical protein